MMPEAGAKSPSPKSSSLLYAFFAVANIGLLNELEVSQASDFLESANNLIGSINRLSALILDERLYAI
ncbi:MAG TPA: hypothetical protein DEP37_07185 [Algoriphagus sp.]|nr:hypothetical protein [Algoriphagus sp.]